MSDSNYPKTTFITDLEEVESIVSGDILVVHTKEGKTVRLDFKNFLIGFANTTFESLIADHEGRITTLESTVSGQTITLPLYGERLTKLETKSADHGTRLISLETLTSSNLATLSSHAARLTTLETASANYAARISALEGIVSGHSATLTNHGGRIVSLESRMTSAELGLVTPGTIFISAHVNPSPGTLSCAGQPVSRSTFGQLFAQIGTRYGVGDGSTTFNLPDLRGRVIIHEDFGANVVPGANLLQIGGVSTVSLNADQNGTHGHALKEFTTATGKTGFSPVTILDQLDGIFGLDRNISRGGGTTWLGNALAGANVNEFSGSGAPHTNMQPYMVLRYVIKT